MLTKNGSKGLQFHGVTALLYKQEPLFISYHGRTPGLYEGGLVAVYGVIAGPVSGTNAWGAMLTMPAIEADYLLYPLDYEAELGKDW
jgi:hypothetical protein